jgi:parallel beta-helix repeat protein
MKTNNSNHTPIITAKTLILISLALGLAPLAAQSCSTYYVSPTGNDNNPGTLASPWKSIMTSGYKIKPCDTLYARGGVYKEYGIYLSQVGTAAAPTKVLAYGTELPVLDGTGTQAGMYDGFFNLNGQYITVQGFEVRFGGVGVYLNGNYNTVSNMNVHDMQQNGILARGDYSVVQNSQVHQTCLNHYNYLHNIAGGLANWGSGLSAARNLITGITKNATLTGNTVYNNWGEGLSTYEANGTVMSNNVVYDNWTTNAYISDASNVIFHDNLVYNTPGNIMGNGLANVLSLADEVSAMPRSSNNTVINNMFLNGNVSLFSWTLVPNSGLTNAFFSNNTLVNGTLQTGSINLASTVQNNVIQRTDGQQVSQINTLNNITFNKNLWSGTPNLKLINDLVAAPQLSLAGTVSPGQLTKNYFAPTSNSPAIGKGASILVVTGSTLITNQAGTVNVGAYVTNPPINYTAQ